MTADPNFPVDRLHAECAWARDQVRRWVRTRQIEHSLWEPAPMPADWGLTERTTR